MKAWASTPSLRSSLEKVEPTVTYTPSVNPLGRQGEPTASRKFPTLTGRLAPAAKKKKEAAELAAS
jgi:hypothetical protein